MPAPVSAIAIGHLVALHRPRSRDREEFCVAARRSRALHGGWVRPPLDATTFRQFLKRCDEPAFRAFLVRRIDDRTLVGVLDLSQIFRGILQSAYLGYYAFEPFVGAGYMSEGLHLLLRHAFRELKLHRLEANIQPGNLRSLAFVARAGFRREGYSPRYLKIGGRWRDHERWALLADEWPRFRASESVR